MIPLFPQDRISDRNGEQTIDIPIRQIQEKLVEGIQLVLQEPISDRIVERRVEVPVVVQAA